MFTRLFVVQWFFKRWVGFHHFLTVKVGCVRCGLPRLPCFNVSGTRDPDLRPMPIPIITFFVLMPLFIPNDLNIG